MVGGLKRGKVEKYFTPATETLIKTHYYFLRKNFQYRCILRSNKKEFRGMILEHLNLNV